MDKLESSLKVAAQGFVTAVMDAVSRDRAQEGSRGADEMRKDVRALAEAVKALADTLIGTMASLESSLSARGSLAEQRRGISRAIAQVSKVSHSSAKRGSKDESIKAVVDFIRKREGNVQISEVASKLGKTIASVRGLIHKAIDAGMIRMEGNRGSARYWPVNGADADAAE